MTFLESRIDTKITAGAKSIVRWNRDKAYTKSGHLSQQFNWSNAKHELDLSHGIRTREDFQTVLDFFYVVMAGGYTGFRVKDWRDYTASQTNSNLTFITGSTWQLQRKHTAGSGTYLRNITKPVASTAVVKRTKSGVVTTASASVDYTTGIATISGHTTGDTYTWEGEFDVPMTFVDDVWTSELEAGTVALWVSSQPIMLEEIRI